MLQKIQQRLTGWVTIVIVGLLCLAFGLWGIQYYVTSGAKPGVIAKVGRYTISEHDLKPVIQRMRALAKSRGQTPSTAVLKQQAIMQLVEQSLLTQAALDAGMVVTPAQVQQYLMSIPQFKVNGVFSEQLFRAYLRYEGLTEQELYQRLKSQLLSAQPTERLVGTDFVLPTELSEDYSLVMQQRDIGYFILPQSRYLKKVVVKAGVAHTYYQQHAAEFTIPAEVKVAYLHLSPNAVARQVAVSDSQQRRYYDRHTAQFMQPAQWQVERWYVSFVSRTAHQKVQLTEQALAFSRQLSTHSSTHAPKLPAGFTQDQKIYTAVSVPAQLRRSLDVLPVGAVSKPILVGDELMVVRIKTKQSGHVRPFNMVQAKIKAYLLREKKQALLATMSEKLADLTFTSASSLAVAGRSLGLQVQTTDYFAQYNGSGIAKDPVFDRTAFSDTVLHSGANSEPVVLSDGSRVVMRLVDFRAARQKPFSEVRDQIQLKLQHERASADAMIAAFDLVKAINKGKDPRAVALKNNLKWQTKTNQSRVNAGDPIVAAAFSLGSSSINHATTATLKDKTVAVVVLTGVKPAVLDKSRNKAMFMQAVLHHEQQQLGRLYLQVLEHHYGIRWYTSSL